MRRVTRAGIVRWAIVLFAAAGLGVGVVPTKAEQAKEPAADAQAAVGSISGMVTKDGKPVVNARITLVDQSENPKAKGAKGAVQGNDTPAQKPAKQKPGKQDPAGKKQRVPSATTMTDGEGHFVLDVKPGTYMVVAQVKGEGRGRAPVTVTAGQTASVDLKITAAGTRPDKPAKPGKAQKPAKQKAA